MIVEEVKIEKVGSANKKYGGPKIDYYKIMIFVFDKWWDWQPKDIRERLSLEDAMKTYDELRGRIHAN